MSKFTAGKWEYGTHSIKAVTPEETISIAFMYQPNSKEEAQANARLIAAAPEMYGLIEQLAFGSCDDCIPVMVAARKLLARIDGEETKDDCD